MTADYADLVRAARRITDDRNADFIHMLANAIEQLVMTTDEPTRCPRCNSPAPHLHPAMQYEGEVQPCSHPFHERDTPENKP